MIPQAYDYIWAHGLMSEEDYPYLGTDRNECKFDTSKVVTKFD